MTAILFGSISTVADTSELQRDAFNEAFAQHGLDWRWEREEYRSLLEGNGGRDRVAAYAEQRGEDVDAEAVHRTKSEIFQRRLAEGGLEPREGVVDTIRIARENGVRLGLVTTTSPENVVALAHAVNGEVNLAAFDVVVDASHVDAPKPDAAAYAFALERLGEDAGDVVAIEDNIGGTRSAESAGVRVVAFPNANTAGHDFGGVDRVERLDFEQLLPTSATA